MLEFFFILGVILIPFNDFGGTALLGEMQHELSAYIFLPALALGIFGVLQSLNRNGAAMPQLCFLPKFMLAIFGVILISCLMNFPEIMEGSFRGRAAPVKFLTSTMVMGYGFGLAYLTYFISQQGNWQRLILRPIGISVGICAVIATVEMASWYDGFTAGFYALLSKLIHPGSDMVEMQGFAGGAFGWGHIEGRARSVCFEAPALANFAGFAWPWLYAGMAASRGGRKLSYALLWLLCSGLILAAASRTGDVLLLGNFIVLGALRFIYLPMRPQRRTLGPLFTWLFWGLGTLALVALIMNADSFAKAVTRDDNVSNLSRYASMTAAFRMFLDSPVWGYGFGQYGFHLTRSMPSWGYYSWEVRAWLTDPTMVWPPVFSIYARLAAETGLLGLCVWIGGWYLLARALVRETLVYQQTSGIMPPYAYPLIISCWCALFSGIALDSLRTPMMWIALGLSCAYLSALRHTLRNSLIRAQLPQEGQTPFHFSLARVKH